MIVDPLMQSTAIPQDGHRYSSSISDGGNTGERSLADGGTGLAGDCRPVISVLGCTDFFIGSSGTEQITDSSGTELIPGASSTSRLSTKSQMYAVLHLPQSGT
jgi:hypothetical protein